MYQKYNLEIISSSKHATEIDSKISLYDYTDKRLLFLARDHFFSQTSNFVQTIGRPYLKDNKKKASTKHFYC